MVHVPEDGDYGLADRGHRPRRRIRRYLKLGTSRGTGPSLLKPRLIDSGVRVQLVRFEKQRDLALRALRRIRTVDYVAPNCEGEVPANRPGRAPRAIRLHHPAGGRSAGAVPLEDEPADGSCRDVRHEWLEERLPLMLRVIGLSEGPRDPKHLHRDDLQSSPFEPADNLSDEGSLDGIRLQEDERAFGGHHVPFFDFFAVGAGVSASSSSGFSRLRPFTRAHCPSSHALKTRRPSWESFHAANSALSTWVPGFRPSFFCDQPRIEVRNALPPVKPVKNFSSSPRGRSGPSRLSIRSPRSAGISFPFGVSIVTFARSVSAATGASSATMASSVTARPAARRNACVQGVHRGTRPRCSMFDWHLWEQNRNTVPSLRMNIFPVPGSISLPQKEQERRAGIVSPDRELPRFPRRLAEHEDVSDLDAPLHVARDDPTLVAPVEDADLHLDRFARHARSADDLDHLCGDAVLVRHRISSFLGGLTPSSSRGACWISRRARASPFPGRGSRSRPSPSRGPPRRPAPACSGRTHRARPSLRTEGACGRGSPPVARPRPSRRIGPRRARRVSSPRSCPSGPSRFPSPARSTDRSCRRALSASRNERTSALASSLHPSAPRPRGVMSHRLSVFQRSGRRSGAAYKKVWMKAVGANRFTATRPQRLSGSTGLCRYEG